MQGTLSRLKAMKAKAAGTPPAMPDTSVPSAVETSWPGSRSRASSTPEKVPKVATTISLAIRPVKAATTNIQPFSPIPKPSGTNSQVNQ